MDFEPSAKVKELQKRLCAFMDEHIYPNEQRFYKEIEQDRWTPSRVSCWHARYFRSSPQNRHQNRLPAC